jgi:cell division inhibitor SulA
MSGPVSVPRPRVQETVEGLRSQPGLFSFREIAEKAESTTQGGLSSPLFLRPGGIVEWLVASEGAGAMTLALQILSQSSMCSGTWAVMDTARECYLPAMSGWGIDPNRILVLRPATLQETCWSIEQCLRCPGISATWAWVDRRIPARVHRRWQMAAEVGGGVGMLFRPVETRREPVWADSRLLVTPRSGGQGETRRLIIEVLYRKGGLGGSTQAWEIDYAAGLVRLVPEVANPTTANRAARA